MQSAQISLALLAMVGVALCLLVPSTAKAQCAAEAGDLDMLLPGHERCGRRRRAPRGPALRVGVSGLLGTGQRDVPLNDLTSGVAIPIDLTFGDVFGVGARFGYQVAADANVDANGDGIDDADEPDHGLLTISAGPHLVLHTEPARREAWRFEVNGGYLFATDDVAPSGPMLELAISRQAGSLTVQTGDGYGTGWEVTLGLRAQQGLGDAADYQALLLEAGAAVELGVPLPRGPAPRRTRPGLEYTFGGDADLAIAFHEEEISFGAGGGLFVGFPLGTIFEPRLRMEAIRVSGPADRDGATILAGLAGIHLARWFPLFAEVLGGYARPLNQPGPYVEGGLVEIAVGLQLPNVLQCGLGVHIAHRLRIGTVRQDEERAFFTVGVAIGMHYDNLVRAAECPQQ